MTYMYLMYPIKRVVNNICYSLMIDNKGTCIS